jgi:hypothetical protein
MAAMAVIPVKRQGKCPINFLLEFDVSFHLVRFVLRLFIYLDRELWG